MNMNTNETIRLARKHIITRGDSIAMLSSAELCLSDAITLHDNGELDRAKARAIDSLAYSVGILHADYARAIK